MRFCEECGARLEDDAKFCEECGAEQESLVGKTTSVTTNEDSEYGFCEECGARIKITDKFCEVCGTVIGQQEAVTQGFQKEAVLESADIKQAANISAPIKSEPLPDNTEIKASQNPGRKKGVRFLWIPVAIVVLVAVMAGGYFIGQNSGGKQNSVQSADNMDNAPTPVSTEEPVAIITQTEIPTATPTIIPTTIPTVTPTVVPSEDPKAEGFGKSIFEGYRAGEHIGSKIRMDGPNGVSLFLDSTAKPLANGYITDGNHYFEFEFIAGNVICYPEHFSEGDILLVNSDVLRIELSENGAYVYWGYVQNGQTEVYYKGNVSMSDAECIGEYIRVYSNSLKYFESSDKVLTANPFQKVIDGTVLEVAYSGDDEKLGFGFVYNHEIDVLHMELYCHEEEAYLYGYANGQIYYEEDTVYYLAPVYEEDGVYWDEIPYMVTDGEKKYNLTGYDIYCEVRMMVFEDGISLYWSAHENGLERVFYDDFFDSKHMQRKAYVKHY